MPVSDWSDLMTDIITYRQVASRDEYGKPSYAADQTIACRVVYKITRVMSRATGQDALSAAQVWLLSTITPVLDDQFVLPDGSTPVLLTWELFADENGPHHTKLYFGGADFGGSRG